jgi:hypothetical protein
MSPLFTVISLYDLLLYDLTDVHPSFKQGERPPSRQPTFYWPDFPRPPKHYWQLWYHFLHTHMHNYISGRNLSWSELSPPRYVINCVKHTNYTHLFEHTEGQMCQYHILP